MATSWAMTQNFERRCTPDEAVIRCAPPTGYKYIKGALLTASFASGAAYTPAGSQDEAKDRNIFAGALQSKYNIAFYPSSDPLRSIHKWPALFVAKGLWDTAESLEGKSRHTTVFAGSRKSW